MRLVEGWWPAIPSPVLRLEIEWLALLFHLCIKKPQLPEPCQVSKELVTWLSVTYSARLHPLKDASPPCASFASLAFNKSLCPQVTIYYTVL
jgi:hypothetical protein